MSKLLIQKRLSSQFKPKCFDFRSDTVTIPTLRMREAMFNAKVGDDVFHEDSTVNRFERFIADYCNKEMALFCPSGTMSNQLALRSHLISPPYTLLLDKNSHINLWENSGAAYHCGAGTIAVDSIKSSRDVIASLALDDGDIHTSPTRLVALENTLDGVVMPLSVVQSIYENLKTLGIPVHLDGARLWNAAVRTNTHIKDWTTSTDSVSLCFSKGLGAPVGSVLVGSGKFIERARKFRKLYGGGWRQAGHLAAAAHAAFEEHFPKQLLLDHDRAQAVAKHVALAFRNSFVLTKPVETNMVWLKPTNPRFNWADCASLLKQKYSVLVPGYDGACENRLVFHYQIDDVGIDCLKRGLGEYISTL